MAVGIGQTGNGTGATPYKCAVDESTAVKTSAIPGLQNESPGYEGPHGIVRRCARCAVCGARCVVCGLQRGLYRLSGELRYGLLAMATSTAADRRRFFFSAASLFGRPEEVSLLGWAGDRHMDRRALPSGVQGADSIVVFLLEGGGAGNAGQNINKEARKGDAGLLRGGGVVGAVRRHRADQASRRSASGAQILARPIVYRSWAFQLR